MHKKEKFDLNYFSIWNLDINLERNLIPSKLITGVVSGTRSSTMLSVHSGAGQNKVFQKRSPRSQQAE